MKRLNLLLVAVLFQSCKTTQKAFVYSEMLWTLTINADQNKIAAGGNNGKLWILSNNNFEIIKTYELPNTITKVEWHPSQDILAVIRQWNDESNSDDTKSKIIDFSNNKIYELENFGGRGLGWSNDGEYLAIGGGDGVVHIYNKTGERYKRIETTQKAITGLNWHPHKYIITTVGSHIEIVNIDEDTSKKIIPRAVEILMLSVQWHPSGRIFATSDYGNTDSGYPPLIQLWDSNGNKLQDFYGSKSEIRNIKWINNGANLLSSSDKIRIWNQKGAIIHSSKKESLFWGVDMSKTNQSILATTEYGEIIAFNKTLKTRMIKRLIE